MNQLRLILTFALAIIIASLVAFPTHAGPPLLCHEIEVGDVKSLPWGHDTFTKASDYSVANVVDDTLKLLTPEMPVLARMETLRRATLYLQGDPTRAETLFGSLLTRVLDAEVVMDEKVLALRYFDAGYFAATMQQAGIEVSFSPNNGKHDLHRVPGYAWMVRGWKMNELDGDMALGLALVTADTRMTEHDMFLAKAVQSIRTDDKPRNDLLKWVGLIRGSTLEELRAKHGTADARSER